MHRKGHLAVRRCRGTPDFLERGLASNRELRQERSRNFPSAHFWANLVGCGQRQLTATQWLAERPHQNLADALPCRPSDKTRSHVF